MKRKHKAETTEFFSHREWRIFDELAFVVVEGPHKGDRCPVDKEMIRIGRKEWCDLSLAKDKGVSSEHCECWLEARGVRIRDLGSRNGIFVGESQILTGYVLPGGRIRLGNSVLELRQRSAPQKVEIAYSDPTEKIVGQSESMRRIFSMIARLGKRDIATILTGETGTGKTTIADILHQQSHRAEGPFVVVNCGALPSSLVEALFLGYEKGAFTGAIQQHKGFLEQAHGGTLFLDEIADLPIELQPKFLDVLERKKVRRLGSAQEISTDFRLITATHKDLKRAMQKGDFRRDLYYRIAAVELHVPSLRERMEDLPRLVEHILHSISPDQACRVTPEAMELMLQYLWPGNIRQLQNTLERAVALAEPADVLWLGPDEIYLSPIETQEPSEEPEESSLHELLRQLAQSSWSAPPPVESETQEMTGFSSELSLKEQMEQYEKELLEAALHQNLWNVTNTAKQLGLSQGSLYNRMKRYDIKRP
ncbi:MAG: sigma 54-dependent Fis family transcriptional regulator [Deltaproteobacteria bacterium]|nr:MAG: sigma 54-dependent Fis family transcriptional regulator [Deltaproteobacteria bacterium]